MAETKVTKLMGFFQQDIKNKTTLKEIAAQLDALNTTLQGLVIQLNANPAEVTLIRRIDNVFAEVNRVSAQGMFLSRQSQDIEKEHRNPFVTRFNN